MASSEAGSVPKGAEDTAARASPGHDDTEAAVAVDEKKLIAKVDRHIVPLIMLAYTLSFLDRVNIGNARLYGLEADLGLTGNQYQIAVSILFVTYLLMEVPSNLALKPVGPSRWLAFIIVSWGIVATLTGVVQSYGGLVACRLILGALEAGLFPGLNVYLTFWYTKHELALRVGYLFVSAAIAGAFGGLLAFAIGHMGGVAGLAGWRWILIIEGLPSVLLGVAVWWLLPDDAASAYFLNPAEKAAMAARLRRGYGATESAQEFSRADMVAAFTDVKVWLFSVAQFGIDTMLYGFSTFLPTIIQGLGDWSAAEVQLLTIPCYFLGAMTYMTVAWLSDRCQRRAVFIVVFGCVSAVGYAVLCSNSSAGVHYFGCFLVAAGLYVSVGLPLAWLPNNSPRYGKRTTATGLQLTLGNCSGILAPFIYLSGEGPRYVRGNAVSLGMVLLAVALYAVLWLWYRRLNAARDAGLVKPEHADLSDDERAELGDESPGFRYTY